MERTLYQI